MSKCAACGKGGDGLKTCTACKLVKYCNATCQKTHRPVHKKECKRRAAELHDEVLFKDPPPRAECPICTLPLPLDYDGQHYQSCCGKVLCDGCIHAAINADRRGLCPFCRTSCHTTEEEWIERMEKRAEGNDARAIRNLGGFYRDGRYGLPQDRDKGMKLWHRAGALGCSETYFDIADSYRQGIGVERDMKKAKHNYELAAMAGIVPARHNVGNLERNAGNMSRAMSTG